MIDQLLVGSLILLIISILATIYRLIKGPSPPDIIQSCDIFGNNLIAVVAIWFVLVW
ncbi:hypothetical protein ACEF17_10825 [Streptococcus hyovaginalis]